MARSTSTSERSAGRAAKSPSQIGKHGWKDIFQRVRKEYECDHVTMVAGGVAFFAFLAIPPALAALLALYGLWANPADVQTQVATYAHLLPAGASDIIEEQMARLAAEQTTGLRWSAIIAIALSVWAANKGMKGLVKALNIAYDEDESRGFIALNVRTLSLTLGGLLAVAIMIGLIAVVPALLGSLPFGEVVSTAIDWLRWPVLALFVVFALAVLYAYAPDRKPPQFKWVTPGALFAVVAFLVVSALFSFYVSKFGSYNETYGSIAAVAVLLLWLFLSALVTLVGAEINAETERQTLRDSTRGAEEPMGRRGAHAADTVPSPG